MVKIDGRPGVWITGGILIENGVFFGRGRGVGLNGRQCFMAVGCSISSCGLIEKNIRPAGPLVEFSHSDVGEL